MEIQLTHAYPGVLFPGGSSYGGSQKWLESAVMQRCGCGVVAVLDLVRYLHLYHPAMKTPFFTGVQDMTALPKTVYDLCTQRMRRSFVPILYPVGTTGISLAAGLNRYFKRYGLPLRAKWGVRREKLWPEIESMLRQDIPVILSVGNRFPRFWKKEGVSLHCRQQDEMKRAAQAHAHFVVVTGMDDTWLHVSSWGKEYYLSKEEFLRYRSEDSMPLLCNMVYIRYLTEAGGQDESCR